MLHSNIHVRKESVIEGTGLVAVGVIQAGEVVSRLEPNQPRTLISAALTMSEAARDILLQYGYQCNETEIVSEQDDGKYMNHSCDPNTWWLDDDTMIARRDIAVGEEITYDYATTEVTIPWQMICRCGAANCRNVVTNLDHRDPAWQARFGEHLPAHTLKAIHAWREQQ